MIQLQNGTWLTFGNRVKDVFGVTWESVWPQSGAITIQYWHVKSGSTSVIKGVEGHPLPLELPSVYSYKGLTKLRENSDYEECVASGLRV